MSIRVLYFAGLREAFSTSGEEVALAAGISTAGALRDHIAGRGEPWDRLTQTRNLRCAVNQKMVDFQAAVKDGDEVAFFPPVTGG